MKNGHGVPAAGSKAEHVPAAGTGLLDSLRRFGEKPGLARIEFLLEKLGRPQDRFPAVHVAGTNGKGSTAAMIGAVLQAVGLRVGAFTSPHLVRYNERITVDRESVSDEDLDELSRLVQPVTAEAAATGDVGQPTEFEVATAMAFAHFAQKRVDVAVVEVGLGGRLDSTNVVDAVVSVITPVGIDHTAVLGNTLAEIAAEKAGILRPGVPLVLARQTPEAAAVIRRRARELGIDVYEQGVDYDATGVELAAEGTTFHFITSGAARTELVGTEPGGAGPGAASGSATTAGPGAAVRLQTPLVGAHQADNGATAVAAAALALNRLQRVHPDAPPASGAVPLAKVICERSDVFRAGLARTNWPGRFEIVGREPLTILDGAHNVESARALAASLRAVVPNRPLVFVVGMLKEKPIPTMFDTLLPLADAVVFTKPSQGRTPAAEPEHLAATARRLSEGSSDPDFSLSSSFEPTFEIEPEPTLALARARSMAGPGGAVVVWGSLYLVGEMKSSLPAEL